MWIRHIPLAFIAARGTAFDLYVCDMNVAPGAAVEQPTAALKREIVDVLAPFGDPAQRVPPEVRERTDALDALGNTSASRLPPTLASAAHCSSHARATT